MSNILIVEQDLDLIDIIRTSLNDNLHFETSTRKAIDLIYTKKRLRTTAINAIYINSNIISNGDNIDAFDFINRIKMDIKKMPFVILYNERNFSLEEITERYGVETFLTINSNIKRIKGYHKKFKKRYGL